MAYITKVFPYDDENGMVILPDKLVEELGLKDGDELICAPSSDGSLLLSKKEGTE
ncbi:AbrB/MazE/SpoVT family DNA-binding domain-containing protein [Aquisalinus flavus]|uniref:AbrB/MazE/SpoVT family DNA-binding domain-containing protein n=1 Tax=Aquisalinus flavus TaxID=1526572 RepID=A0A8J2V280_9PROT|nr:AbrB/MazE/SpoVT family DNA-binding domain-containing protein [Aquisalinus flavus]MBD0427228.1 AbrB/MazE/SpoVT family DNA-binding domain-containing protein [Aquisalinus flavus]UNE47043.1 AbrB/MazE/SpoVT family DNA-binding domain-containing protein [Aquisalinus flavus]GGC99345.1 hypothetical protein GCM10011342_05420 [Aquisalinus flavus]